MNAPAGSIFICYRRDDSADIAGRIYDRLVAEFGKDAIYRDVDTIPFGEDFREHIRGCLSACRVGLVIIGPEWTEIRGRSGRARLHEPADHVRLEVEAMLARRELKTIPLFVRGAEAPVPETLPEVLQPLAYKNGADIRRDPDFHHDMDRVLAQLRRHLAPPAPPLAAEPAPRVGADLPAEPREPVPIKPDPAPAGLPTPRPTPPVAVPPGFWPRFVAWLWPAPVWGWIWIALGLLGSVLMFGGAFAASLVLLGLVALSPAAAAAHWRDGHRRAAWAAGGYALVFFGTFLIANQFTSGLSGQRAAMAAVQILYSLGWVIWLVRLDRRPAAQPSVAKTARWRTLHPVEWIVLGLATALPGLWSGKALDILLDPARQGLPFASGAVLAGLALAFRRWDAAAVALVLITAQRSIFYYVDRTLDEGSFYAWVALWSAVVSLPGAVLVWRSPAGPGTKAGAWWRESVAAAGRTPLPVAIAALVCGNALLLPFERNWKLAFAVPLALWTAAALLAALPRRWELRWPLLFLVLLQTVQSTGLEILALTRSLDAAKPFGFTLHFAATVLGVGQLVLGRRARRPPNTGEAWPEK